jgi:hypothetical protein
MIKVLKIDEIEKGKRYLYSESYEVIYWYESKGFWRQNSEMYFTASKNKQEQVANRWRKDHFNENVKLISVNYQ